jgi:hypothetical protein
LKDQPLLWWTCSDVFFFCSHLLWQFSKQPCRPKHTFRWGLWNKKCIISSIKKVRSLYILQAIIYRQHAYMHALWIFTISAVLIHIASYKTLEILSK